MRRTVNGRVATMIAGMAMLAACSSSSTGGGSTSASSASTTSTTVDTTPDTVAATTTTSTTVPATIEFTLRGGGIGPFDFGVHATELVDALTAQFGPKSSDELQEYPTDNGVGGFESADGEFGFTFPFGRTVCWAFEFCIEFGGDAADIQQFAGWSYGEDSGLTLASESGVTVGSRWSDFPTMNIHPGGCYTVGFGDIDGIDLTVQSDEVAFGSFDDAGNYIEAVPPPEQVAVTFMQAGDSPAFLFGDC